MWSLMDAHMPGPICVKLSEFVEGRWEIHLGQKKKSNFFFEEFFFEEFFFACNPTLISAGVMTLSALRTVA